MLIQEWLLTRYHDGQFEVQQPEVIGGVIGRGATLDEAKADLERRILNLGTIGDDFAAALEDNGGAIFRIGGAHLERNASAINAAGMRPAFRRVGGRWDERLIAVDNAIEDADDAEAKPCPVCGRDTRDMPEHNGRVRCYCGTYLDGQEIDARLTIAKHCEGRPSVPNLRGEEEPNDDED